MEHGEAGHRHGGQGKGKQGGAGHGAILVWLRRRAGHVAVNATPAPRLTGSPPPKAALSGLKLLAPWIEETLRHDTSSQMLARYVVSDRELAGVTIPAGAKALVLLGSANRDERVFTEPTRFDIHRDRAELSQILSFGTGRHFCLGANLARLEAKVVLAELVRRRPTRFSSRFSLTRVTRSPAKREVWRAALQESFLCGAQRKEVWRACSPLSISLSGGGYRPCRQPPPEIRRSWGGFASPNPTTA